MYGFGLEVLRIINIKPNMRVELECSAVTLAGVGHWTRGKFMKEEKKSIESDAIKAIRYNLVITNKQKAIKRANSLTHKPSCYGIALKWLLYIRGMTYEQFAKKYNGTTKQNLNYIINRMSKNNVLFDEIDKMAQVLNVEYEYFMELAKAIDSKME